MKKFTLFHLLFFLFSVSISISRSFAVKENKHLKPKFSQKRNGFKIKKKKFRGFKMNSIYPKTMHRLPIINNKQRPYLAWLKSGIKTAEGRVNGPACQKMKVGDTILLFDNKNMQYLCGRIKFKHEYKTFEDMLQSEGTKNLLPFLPENATVEDGVRIYRSFPGSNRVEQFGCVAIGLEIFDSKL